MTVSISSQAYIFLCSVVGGAVMAFIFDLFRIIRKAVRTANILTYIQDLAFWVIVALVMFATVYYSNEGELRSYIFLGTLLGVILYALLLSKPIMSSSLFIIRIVATIIKAVWMIVSYPFKITFKILAVPARAAKMQSGRIFRGIRRAGRNRLSKAAIWKRVFRNIRKKI